MQKLLSILCVGLAGFILGGCAIGLGKSLHQYSILSYEKDPKNRKVKTISVEETDYVVLSMAFDTEYVEQAYQKFLRACPNGEIINVSARHSTDLGILAYRDKIVLEGECVQ